MRKIYFPLSFFIIFLYSFLPPSYGKVYIDINSPSSHRFPVIISKFKNIENIQDKTGISSKMPLVISNDLEFSGLFRIIDPEAIGNSYLDGLTSDKIKWDILSIVGAEAVVTGGYSIKSHDKLSIDLRIFDAVQGKFITGKRYEGKTEDFRLMAHRFSNEIFEKLTGEKGIFDTKIAFVKNINGNKNIFIADYDGKESKQSTNYNSLTLSPAWSPDGKRIAFTSYKDGNPDLYVKNIYSGTIEKVSRKYGINIAPSWSPDGKKIALTLSLNNGNSEIYLINLINGKLERLTNDWATDVSPAFSPDGTNIAFVSSRAGTPQIYILNIINNKIKRLTYNGNYNTSPAWSPRGDKIVYSGLAGGKFQIHIVSSDGQNKKQLTFENGNNEDPSWSPDGQFLTFSADGTGQKEIYIMRADGTGIKKITDGKGEKSDPAWSPFPGK